MKSDWEKVRGWEGGGAFGPNAPCWIRQCNFNQAACPFFFFPTEFVE